MLLCYSICGMRKIVPFGKFIKEKTMSPFLTKSSAVMDEKGIPLGFVFGRDAFISFLEQLDSEFEKRAKNDYLAFSNPAGKLIDLIEEKLTVNPRFAKELKQSTEEAGELGWLTIEDVTKALHV